MHDTRDAAAVITSELDLDRELAPYEPLRWDGSLTGALTLHLDDFSAIPFLDEIVGVTDYQHRARLRAGDGDLFAASTPQTEAYEEYCRDVLALGSPEFVLAGAAGGDIHLAAALRQASPARALIGRARDAGGLAIHPYMGTETVWKLASTIRREANVPVQVLAPPPPVTWVANDKGRFSQLVELTLGRDWLVETFEETRPSHLAERLSQLATRHEKVALKRLRCASAMGNRVFDAAAIRARPAVEVERLVRSCLADTGWRSDEAVLAVAWERASSSPSTQLWIPPAGGGSPRVDGIYEQILEQERGVFVGSRPSGLPESVNLPMAAASIELARELQQLGYVGRCSFDFLVVDSAEGDHALRLTECNGRWGGTSTPMSLLDRWFPERPPYRAQDFADGGLVGATLPDILERVGPALFCATQPRGRFIFYNTGPLTGHGKLSVIALGSNQEEAEEALEEDLPRLLGL
jgi:hypothetical protein